ncbi:hypothetical protein PCASD_06031 [Puccinia coronata f. sp. avenae]|uniref:Uncharacterized protein n=1 Tax=Puccinia coronata f. sp. avenae TaxID=200324 RepID=A0A2N5V9Y5_9BASI|nr:hypothetical protein PCASD_06031 [Puccinia coronata f. sp. avenae]
MDLHHLTAAPPGTYPLISGAGGSLVCNLRRARLPCQIAYPREILPSPVEQFSFAIEIVTTSSLAQSTSSQAHSTSSLVHPIQAG